MKKTTLAIVLVCYIVVVLLVEVLFPNSRAMDYQMDPYYIGNAPTAGGPNDNPGPGPMAPDPELSQ